jgi:hypothetical protein
VYGVDMLLLDVHRNTSVIIIQYVFTVDTASPPPTKKMSFRNLALQINSLSKSD